MRRNPFIGLSDPRGLLPGGVLLIGAIAALVATLAAPAGAVAQTPEEPASIVVFKLEGDASRGELRDSLTRVIRQRVQANQRYSLVNDNPVTLSDVSVVLGCGSIGTSCLGKAADHFGADYLVFGKIEESGGRSRISVRLFDPASGRYVRSFGRVMTRMSAPYEAFGSEVETLLQTDEQRRKTKLRIRANVKGAEVLIDGAVQGKTPFKREGLSPGSYEIEVRHPEREPWSTTVELKAGGRAKLSATLEQKAAPRATADETTSEGSTDQTEESAEETAVAAESGESSTGGPETDAAGSDYGSDSGRSAASSWGPWVALGVGGAGLIGASIQGARVVGARNDLDDWRSTHAPAGPNSCAPAECDIIQRGERAETAHYVLIGVGGAATAGGLIWLLVRGGKEKPARAKRQGLERLDVMFTGSGVSANWRW